MMRWLALLGACALSACGTTTSEMRAKEPVLTWEFQMPAKQISDCIFQDLPAYDRDLSFRRSEVGGKLYITAEFAGAAEDVPGQYVQYDIEIAPAGDGSNVTLRALTSVWGKGMQPKSVRGFIEACGRSR